MIKIGDFGLSKQLRELETNHVKSQKTKSPTKKPVSPRKAAAKPVSHDQLWHQASKAVVSVVKPIQALVRYQKPIDPLTAGIGTASSASPEQIKSRSYGTSADIFSVGLILLELISCFDTEHERLHNFHQCRNQTLPTWVQDTYPEIAGIILDCTKSNPGERPEARRLVDRIDQILTPHPYGLDIHTLKGTLLQKEQELERHKSDLAEKEKIIESLRQEVERMKANGAVQDASEENVDVDRLDNNAILVENATSFQD